MPRFCSQYSKPLFVDTTPPHPFRENPRCFAFFLFAWATALPRVDLISKDGFRGCMRDGKKIPSHGSDGRKRKKRQADQSPVNGFSESACRFSYNLILISLSQSFKRSSTAASKAVFMDFSIMLKISFSKIDCFFFFCHPSFHSFFEFHLTFYLDRIEPLVQCFSFCLLPIHLPVKGIHDFLWGEAI